MDAYPFKRLTPEQIDELTAQKRDARIAGRRREDNEHFANGTGPYSDGSILDAAGDGINRLMDGPLKEMAEGTGFGDPDAEIGALAVGVRERMRGNPGEKLGAGPSG